MKWYWEEMGYENIEDSSGYISYILLILSIGMLYYQGRCNTNLRQVSSAQTNWTSSVAWEKHKAYQFNFLVFRLIICWVEYPSKQAFRKVQDH
jgi:hypothetical protein